MCVQQLNTLLELSSRLLPEIKAYPPNKDAVDSASLVLPENIINFLSAVLHLSASFTVLSWAAFGDLACSASLPRHCADSDDVSTLAASAQYNIGEYC